MSCFTIVSNLIICCFEVVSELVAYFGLHRLHELGIRHRAAFDHVAGDLRHVGQQLRIRHPTRGSCHPPAVILIRRVRGAAAEFTAPFLHPAPRLVGSISTKDFRAAYWRGSWPGGSWASWRSSGGLRGSAFIRRRSRGLGWL